MYKSARNLYLRGRRVVPVQTFTTSHSQWRRQDLVPGAAHCTCKSYWVFTGGNCRHIGLVAVRLCTGHSALKKYRLFKVTDFGTNRKLMYDFLFVINTNLPLILHCFGDTAFQR